MTADHSFVARKDLPQRVALAHAPARNPKVVPCDNPNAALATAAARAAADGDYDEFGDDEEVPF